MPKFLTQHGVMWYDTLRYDMIWYDMIWYDMIWYDMVWYDSCLKRHFHWRENRLYFYLQALVLRWCHRNVCNEKIILSPGKQWIIFIAVLCNHRNGEYYFSCSSIKICFYHPAFYMTLISLVAVCVRSCHGVI